MATSGQTRSSPPCPGHLDGSAAACSIPEQKKTELDLYFLTVKYPSLEVQETRINLLKPKMILCSTSNTISSRLS